jgi:hypothetical protein
MQIDPQTGETIEFKGLPDRLILSHYITLENGKIVGLKRRLAGGEPRT